MDARYWSRKARSLKPYVAGEQPVRPYIKLNTNENPYPPSPEVAKAVDQAAPNLRLYPPSDGGPFREAAARLHGLSQEEILCTNGSDEGLAFCYLAFFDPDRPVRTLRLSYSFYPVWASLFGIELDYVDLEEDLAPDVRGMAGGGSVMLANPNAPTGIALGEEALRTIIESTAGVCVIDEAYADFGAVSALPWIRDYPNLVVVRTLSKSYSLAGARTGYICANPDLLSALRAVRDSFNSYPVDLLSAAAAAAALNDQAWHQETCGRIVGTRDRVLRELRAMGFEVPESSANFVFMRCVQPDASALYGSLRAAGILVRHFPDGPAPDYLRVTIGTDEQMDVFLETVRDILKIH